MPGFVFILVTYHFYTRCLTSLVARLPLIVRMRQSSRTAIRGFKQQKDEFAVVALLPYLYTRHISNASAYI